MTDRMIVTVHEDRADDERLEALAAALRRELMALDVDDVAPLSEDEAPPGAKGVDLAAVGVLLVVCKQSVEVVKGIVDAIRGWLTASPAGRTVEITLGSNTLKVTSATAAQQERLIAEFVASLKPTAAAAPDATPAASSAPPP